MSLNLASVLTQDGGAALVERYLNKRLMERRDWETVLLNKNWGRTDPLATYDGQWSKFTRKGRSRRPQNLPTPGGAGSDPSSGALLAVDQVSLPIEFLQEYIDIAKTLALTSWINVDEWAREELPYALKRRLHEFVQNRFVVGRFVPGVWSSTSTIATTAFDQTAEATVTLYSQSFTFLTMPKYYCNGKAAFNDLDTAVDRANWADVRRIRTLLINAGARTINGKIVCVCSEPFWSDLSMDNDNGRITAAIAGSWQKIIKGMENAEVYQWAGCMFVIDDAPYTEDANNENKRANFGKIHSALFFGSKAYTWMPLTGAKGGAFKDPPLKLTNITKTGYSYSLGYMIPYQTGILNDTWGVVYKCPVTENLPNGYSAADPTRMLERFQNYA